MYEDGQNSLNFSRFKISAHFLPVMGYRGYEIGAVTWTKWVEKEQFYEINKQATLLVSLQSMLA